MSKKPVTPPPAYFLSLTLENVRSFGEKQTISFARPDGRPAQWTILLGDNGVGKTTVLKALAASVPARKPHSSGSYFPAYTEGFYPNWLPYKYAIKEQAVIETLVGAGYNLSESRPKNKFLFSQDLLIKPRLEAPSFIVAFKSIPDSILGLICYGYGAGRTFGESTLGSHQDVIVDNCLSLFDNRADLLNPEEWFLQMEYSSLKGNKQAGVLLERVRQTLLQVLPDVADLRIEPTEARQQQLELQTPYGWVRLRDMSLGYQTLVVWLTDFASKLFIRYPDSPNPLEEPAIVLIDEIDLHLHPSWQRKLIGFLSNIFKNTQFIATAHSPLVVQAAGDAGANVVLLKREGDQTVVYQNPEDVRGWRLDQILTSELFGLETARSLQTEEKLQRRAELLTKTRRSAAEKKELEQLTQELDAEPLGETPSEREVNAVLQELRQRLLKHDPNSTAA